MNQNVTTTDLKDTICSNCHCKDQKFLHHVWVEGTDQKICTSCVLFTHELSFCPTCFHVHDSFPKEKIVRCKKCSSYSHAYCYSADGSSLRVPACSTCINPERLIFELKESKVKGVEEWRKGIDMDAARLLLTAAKIVNKVIFNAYDEAKYSVWVQMTETVLEKEKATTAIERLMKLGKSNDQPSPLDHSADGEEDGRVTGSLQMLSIEGAASEPQSGRVAMKIHPNEKYPSKNASI